MRRIISNYKITLIITFFILGALLNESQYSTSKKYIEPNNSFTINNSAISNDEKFFILKVDDAGTGLERWLWFCELIENNKSFKANIGVIGNRIKDTTVILLV